MKHAALKIAVLVGSRETQPGTQDTFCLRRSEGVLEGFGEGPGGSETGDVWDASRKRPGWIPEFDTYSNGIG